MAEWITTANGIIALISGLVGLIGTAVGAFFAIKNWITILKTKNGQEIWAMIMEMADAAMKEAERSDKAGAEKKEMVISMVQSGCKAAGVSLDLFIAQLGDYIDQTITFVNNMKQNSK